MINKIFSTILFVCAIVFFAIGLYLTFDNKSYKVKFTNTDDDYVIEIEKNGYIKKPQDPKRSGYDFVGWYEDDMKFDFNSKVSRNVTLEAKWKSLTEDDKSEKQSSISNSIFYILKKIFESKK